MSYLVIFCIPFPAAANVSVSFVGLLNLSIS